MLFWEQGVSDDFQEGLTSRSTHYRSFRRRSSGQSLAPVRTTKITAKSIKPTQKKQNTIISHLHTHAHKRNTG